MSTLTIGLILWIFGHLHSYILPAISHVIKNKLGQKAKFVWAIIILIGVILMIIGYRGNTSSIAYNTPDALNHVVYLSMTLSVFLFGLANVKSPLRLKIRHPMLWGMIIWGISHLLVNGSVADIVLFGGLTLWAALSIVLANRKGAWVKLDPSTLKTRATYSLILASITLTLIIVWIHIWAGVIKFGG